MESQQSVPANLSSRLAVTLGLVPTVLGALALLGWATHTRMLIQTGSVSAPMKFNASLGLLIAGVSVLLLGRSRMAAIIGGILTAALGVVTLCELALDSARGLDQVLFLDWTQFEAAHPGRMAVNTATCLLLAGLALAGSAIFRKLSFVMLAGGGMALVCISGVALAGYVGDIQPAYRWAAVSGMAVNTAVAFQFLGWALLGQVWPGLRMKRSGWIAAVAGCVVVFMTLLVCRSLQADNAKEETALAAAVAANRARLAGAALNQTSRALRHFHERWGLSRNSSPMRADTESYLRDFPEISAIGWLDPSSRASELYMREGNSAVSGSDLLAKRMFASIGEKLPSTSIVSGFMPHGSDREDLVIGIQQSAGAPVFAALIDSSAALQRSIAQDTWVTRVSAGPLQIADLRDPKDSPWHEKSRADESILGQTWTFAVGYKGVQTGSSLPDAIRLAGLIIAGFIWVSVYLWQTGEGHLEEIRTLNAELEDRVAARTRDFEEVNVTLKETAADERIISAKLQERERQLFATFDAGRMGTWTRDLITDTVTREGRLNELFGVHAGESSLPFGEHSASVHPDDREITPSAEQVAIDGPNPKFESEVRRIWPDGSIHWYSILGRVIRDENGRAIKTTGVTADITKRKEAELALKQSEHEFRELADSMPQIVWSAKPDGKLEYYNQRWHEYTGMTMEQTRDRGWRPVLHPDDLQNTIECSTRSITTGAPYDVEYRFKRASDGTYRWHLGRAVPVRDEQGNITHWFGTCTDIEEYKRAEAEVRRLNESLESTVRQRTGELRESEERFRTLVESVLDYSITMLDANGCVATWTAAAERIKGYRSAEILGQHVSRFFTAEDIERGHPQEILRIAATQGSTREEGVRVRKDGSQFWANVAITAVYDEAGQVRGFTKVTQDITGRKAAEQQLTAAREHAEEASRAKSDFLAAMSHEIRTPMNAILGMAEMLWESELDAVQRQYVEVFRRAGGNLLGLINDLLDLSKIEAGRLELETVPFDLEDVLDQAMELTAPKARAKGVSLLCRPAPNTTMYLMGDPTRLRQILINLLGNAVKFTVSGEIVLSVENADSPEELRFSVRDTGIGIPADKLDTVFKDFSQADSSTTRKFGGTGLGLGISRSLVEQMGGHLTVQSVEGEGSTFQFTVRFERAPERERHIDGMEDLSGRRVLLIDDNAVNRLIQREALAAWGLEADEFAVPEAALEALGEASGRPYSLAIVDSRMPQMDGFETAQQLRRIVRDLPIIMLTSDAQPGDAARQRQAGISGYAVKPVRRADLLRMVCEALRGSVPDHPSASDRLHPAPEEPAVAAARETALNILIAEDSSDNRLLVQAYLKTSPHRLTFVEDGKAAAERCRAEAFDLVLMDIQMPVMDGLEATRTIRAYEKKCGSGPVPIVALTANAGPQDAERCRAAGCTAHLSKPISKQKLLAAIDEYGQHREPAPSLDPIEIEIPEGLGELVPGYVEARKAEYPELLALLAASDFDRVRVLAHNMKGSGASFGFSSLTEIGAVIEKSASQSDHAAVQADLHRLGDYLSRVRLPENANESVVP
jgi:PAS domain S-box-containing protein